MTKTALRIKRCADKSVTGKERQIYCICVSVTEGERERQAVCEEECCITFSPLDI